MKKIDLYLFLYEKVVIATTIAAISAFLLYSYNIYSKAFETAQVQAKGYSTLALRLRDLTLGGTIKIGQDIRVAYVKPTRSLPKEISDAADNVSVEIKQIADLIEKQAPQTATLAKKTAGQLRYAAVAFQSEINFNKIQLDAFEIETARMRLEFIEIFNSEINRLVFDEFHSFLSKFQNEIPVWQRPETIVAGALILFFLSTVGLVALIRTANSSVPTSGSSKFSGSEGL